VSHTEREKLAGVGRLVGELALLDVLVEGALVFDGHKSALSAHENTYFWTVIVRSHLGMTALTSPVMWGGLGPLLLAGGTRK